MMKKILVLGSPSTDPGEDVALEKMAEYVRSSVGGHAEVPEVYECHIDEIGYEASNERLAIFDLHNNRELSEYSLVFLRGKLRHALNDVSLVSYYLQNKGVPVINSSFANRGVIGKVPQMFWLHDMGLPIPYTVSAPHKRLPGLISKQLSYPVIVKDVQGAHGNSNFLVKSAEELDGILADNPDIRFMAQEFIPNDCDYRVLIIGDKELIIRRKAVGDSHLNNTSQGGEATIVPAADFPTEVIAQSRKFAESRHYEIAGVDVLFDSNTGEHYFLEINSQPQIASGSFVDEKSRMIGEYFEHLLGK